MTADVAIVGAGYTGLWAAHHLLRLEPSLQVVVLEAETAGWGASGRNGGWCSALFAQSWASLARRSSPAAALALRRALEATVADVGAWCEEYDVDAGFSRGGTITVARNPGQLNRLQAGFEADRRWGGEDTRWLTAADVAGRVQVSRILGATWTPHCAAIQPAVLARALARVVESQGGLIAEQTRATTIAAGRVGTDRGTVHARHVIRATEAYTADLPGSHRDLVPLWSLVVATEPLPDSMWTRLGWEGRETVTDERHLLIYAQRSADGRIVFGGRGAPYRLGSSTAGSVRHRRTFAAIERAMRELFPALRDVTVSHRWSGVLGVPRDWSPSIGWDAAQGIGQAGGYVGDGVGCAALAGHTLAELVLGKDTDRTRLPWVNHRSRRWEPEPLRWLGIRSSSAAMRLADVEEARSGRPSRLAAAVDRLIR
jgi:glycine/D-amino acid oxidase-like deaminating enzyme